MKRFVFCLLLGAFFYGLFSPFSSSAQGKTAGCIWTTSDSLQEFTEKLSLDEIENPEFAEVYIDTQDDTVLLDGEPAELEEVFEVSLFEERQIFSSASAAMKYFSTTVYHAEKINADCVLVTDDYSSCRIMVMDDAMTDSYGAAEVHVYSQWDESVLVFSSPEDTRTAYELLRQKYTEDQCWCDHYIPMSSSVSSATDDGTDQWSYEEMGFDVIQQSEAVKEDTGTLLDNKVRIAVLDSGIDSNHDAFEDCTISDESYDFVRGSHNVTDREGHGTAVSSVIAQATPSNVEIIMLKVNVGNSGYIDAIAAQNALQYAAGLDVDIINMSFGGEGDNDEYDSEFEALTQNDVILVAAAGNESMNVSYSSPANSCYTIAVSATDRSKNLADFSNFGALIDFAAPGTDVRVADIETGGYSEWDGTSFSAPLLCAAAAYVRMLYPESTREDVYEELVNCSIDLGSVGKDKSFGYGMPVLADYLGTLQEVQTHTWKKDTAVSGSKLYFSCIDCDETMECDPKCGKTLNWDWYDNTLYIEGQGSMTEYPQGDFPWVALSSQTKEIVIASTVTEIADGAFAGFESLTEFQTEEGGAFQTDGVFLYSADGSVLYSAIKYLGSVLNVNCQVIRPYALSNCSRVKKMIFSADKIKLMNFSFDGCSKLSELYCWGTPDNWESGIFSGKKLTIYREKSLDCWDAFEKNYGGEIQWKAYYHDVSDWIVSYQSEWEYSGSSVNMKPEVQVDAGDVSAAYTLEYDTEDSFECGEYHFTLISNSSFFEGLAVYTYVIRGLSQNVKVTVPSDSLYIGEEMTLEVDSVGVVSFESSNPEVLSVSQAGVVKAKKAGKVKISVIAAKYWKYESEEVEVSVKVILKAPCITKLEGNSKKIRLQWEAVDGAGAYLIYRKVNRGAWRKIGSSSSLSFDDSVKKCKNQTLYYRVCAYDNGVSGNISAVCKIVVLKAPNHIEAEKLVSGKTKLTWDRNTIASGYQVQYAPNAKFSSCSEIKFSGSKKNSWIMKRLIKNKNYYIRVRSYKGKYYSSWSKTEKLK